MAYVIITVLAPIIMLLVFFTGKRGIFDNNNVSLLNIFVMDFALPEVIFSATVQTGWSSVVQQCIIQVPKFKKIS